VAPPSPTRSSGGTSRSSSSFLPILRGVQSVFNALVALSLLVAAARYVAGMARAGLHFPTPARVHLAILGGLFLLSVAVGYQLDKYELVYSTRGFATGVSYTDAHAQFAAFDILTVLSAFAAAFLVGAAFTRWNWPLGVTVAAWFVASILVGTVYPEAIQRFVVNPNTLAQERPYIANNIAMTRLGLQPRRLGPADELRWGSAPDSRPRSTPTRRPSRTPACGTTGPSVTRSTSSRRSGSITTSSTSTRTATSSTAASASSCSPRAS